MKITKIAALFLPCFRHFFSSSRLPLPIREERRETAAAARTATAATPGVVCDATLRLEERQPGSAYRSQPDGGTRGKPARQQTRATLPLPQTPSCKRRLASSRNYLGYHAPTHPSSKLKRHGNKITTRETSFAIACHFAQFTRINTGAKNNEFH